MIGGHGHVVPRLDGAKARCGGPKMCSECAKEYAQHFGGDLIPVAGWANHTPHGCICPPGSEKTCQGALCPRRPFTELASAVSTSSAQSPTS